MLLLEHKTLKHQMLKRERDVKVFILAEHETRNFHFGPLKKLYIWKFYVGFNKKLFSNRKVLKKNFPVKLSSPSFRRERDWAFGLTFYSIEVLLHAVSNESATFSYENQNIFE